MVVVGCIPGRSPGGSSVTSTTLMTGQMSACRPPNRKFFNQGRSNRARQPPKGLHSPPQALEIQGSGPDPAIVEDLVETVGTSGTAFLMRGQHGYFGGGQVPAEVAPRFPPDKSHHRGG